MSVDINRDPVQEENSTNEDSCQQNADLNFPVTSNCEDLNFPVTNNCEDLNFPVTNNCEDGLESTDTFSTVTSPARTEYSMNSYATTNSADAGQDCISSSDAGQDCISSSDAGQDCINSSDAPSTTRNTDSNSSIGGRSYCSIRHSRSNFWNKEIASRPKSGKINPITGERSGGGDERKFNIKQTSSKSSGFLPKDVKTEITSTSPISSKSLKEDTKSNISDTSITKHPKTMVRRNPITGEGMDLKDCETNSNSFLRSGIRIKQPPGGVSSGIF